METKTKKYRFGTNGTEMHLVETEPNRFGISTLRLHHSALIESSFGKIVVTHATHHDRRGINRYAIVPGIYVNDLAPEHNLRMVEVTMISDEIKTQVSEILRKIGYPERLDFWGEKEFSQ